MKIPMFWFNPSISVNSAIGPRDGAGKKLSAPIINTRPPFRFCDAKEPLNKSSAAEQQIFSLIRAASKTGNTYSIPPFLNLSAEEKSLAVSTCQLNQSFPNYTAQTVMVPLNLHAGG